ncbi:MAG TPA: hypothetical protein VNM89_07360, partial [Solirubrobacterales bacterium]|nr:hypothetical protein [Solirubrobacterales bacterium]
MLSPGEFKFKVVRQLGQGGLGTVDEIEVIETNRSYAVGTRLARKRLNSAWAAEPRAIERFEREITTIKIMSHPNILPYRG